MKKTMKAWIAAGFVGALAAPIAGSAANYGSAGCGLGSIVIGPGHGMNQIFAATTNGTFYSQWFGITTGTSNCAEGGGQAALMQETFISLNQESLSKDVAMGGGEYLNAFARMVELQPTAEKDFNALAQANHGRIFTPGAGAPEILRNFKQVISEDTNLVQLCKL